MIVFINPHLITEAGDPHTGIPIMPVLMVSACTVTRRAGIETQAIDCIGEAPLFMRIGTRGFTAQGLHEEKCVKKFSAEPDLVVLYCRSIASFIAIEVLIKEIRKRFQKTKIAVIENTQAVTSHSLAFTKHLLFGQGVDFVLEGDPDAEIVNLYRAAAGDIDWRQVPGLSAALEPGRVPAANLGLKDLDDLPFPEWDMIRYQGYWELRYAHGPAPRPYLSLLSSRGCPFACAFCSVPSLNNHAWRAHSAKFTVDLLEYYQNKYRVSDFQFEDLNPTSSAKRIREMSQRILDRNLKIRWGTVSGTKIETLDEDSVSEMIAAGCNFLSFSPESGSREHLKKRMNKPFDHEHALRLAKLIKQKGIALQACFVIGYPGETKADQQATTDYIKKLSRIGVDEILVMMATPIPGTRMAREHPETLGHRKPHEFTMASRNQKDFVQLAAYRKYLYAIFFLQKVVTQPWYFIASLGRILTRRFKTKAEQVAYRIVFWHAIQLLSRVRGQRLSSEWETIINRR